MNLQALSLAELVDRLTSVHHSNDLQGPRKEEVERDLAFEVGQRIVGDPRLREALKHHPEIAPKIDSRDVEKHPVSPS